MAMGMLCRARTPVGTVQFLRAPKSRITSRTALHFLRRRSTMSTGREEIVDKLHGALAAFRRERDDLHRKKELATERLRLVTEEREAMEKTIRAMQEKLDQLEKSVSDAGKLQLVQLEKEVERLNQEVRRRHVYRPS